MVSYCIVDDDDAAIPTDTQSRPRFSVLRYKYEHSYHIKEKSPPSHLPRGLSSVSCRVVCQRVPFNNMHTTSPLLRFLSVSLPAFLLLLLLTLASTSGVGVNARKIKKDDVRARQHDAAKRWSDISANRNVKRDDPGAGVKNITFSNPKASGAYSSVFDASQFRQRADGAGGVVDVDVVVCICS